MGIKLKDVIMVDFKGVKPGEAACVTSQGKKLYRWQQGWRQGSKGVFVVPFKRGTSLLEWIKLRFEDGAVVIGAKGSSERRLAMKAVIGSVWYKGSHRALVYDHAALVYQEAKTLSGKRNPSEDDLEMAADWVSYNTIRALEYDGGWRKGMPEVVFPL